MYPTLQQGSHGDDVELLQRLLRDLGYDVGTVDGDFGPRTHDALERYQVDQGLDGIDHGTCGPDTWASLESTFGPLEGLRSQDSVDGYVGDAYGIWNSSMSADDRLNALIAEINQELGAAGVPPVTGLLDPSTPPYALFDFQTWTAHLEPTPFQPENAERLTSQDQATIAGAVYHECRHAEQWFEMARLLAGLHGLGAAEIHQQTAILQEVCEHAAANPMLECTMSNGPAFEWYESVYGSGADQRNATLGTLSNTGADRHWDDYRTDLPEEKDAWETSGTISREWQQYETGGTTVSLPTLHRGAQDDEVRYLQQLLQWHGYYTGRALDGDFGAGTEQAVISFQQANGLTADGVVGKSTWQRLLP